ncbi:cupin-like domain-containing protein [Alteromonas flava]|uniref:cupin-like domain-containing protein n=1 Tax=Alteromonas flava TaxID=2048003 RepID=UPI000C28241A|nr:cupin-like domain-containing protein [Alteromonas flava]
MQPAYATPIAEIQCASREVPEDIYGADSPVVLRGLVADWPAVEAARTSHQAFVSYLTSLYNGKPVNAFMANPEAQGRIFYNAEVDGFNFIQSQVYLDDALNKIAEIAGREKQPTYYVGSLETRDHLPEFAMENRLPLQATQVREAIWLGNQSVVAPHFDFPANIACCVAGERRFTLFSPDQSENMYIGPLDFTPAGQPISMVDIRDPDLAQFPRFRHAMKVAQTTVLQPGDAIYVPSMWWHSVESLSPVNGLVNYWWRETPAYLGQPNQVLLHALMSIKHLPQSQRQAWQALFNHFVFEQPDDMYEHLPARSQQQQSQMTEATARKIKALLINNLK